MAITLKHETPAHSAAIDRLLDSAFGEDRRGKTSYRYRQARGPVDALCLVAMEEDAVVGSIRYWPVLLAPGPRTALLLGPLAVDGGRRALGIGKRLVDETLERAQSLGYPLVFLVGDPVYYRRFGFVPAPDRFVMPDEEPGRLMVHVLNGGDSLARGGTLQPVSGDGTVKRRTG